MKSTKTSFANTNLIKKGKNKTRNNQRLNKKSYKNPFGLKRFLRYYCRNKYKRNRCHLSTFILSCLSKNKKYQPLAKNNKYIKIKQCFLQEKIKMSNLSRSMNSVQHQLSLFKEVIKEKRDQSINKYKVRKRILQNKRIHFIQELIYEQIENYLRKKNYKTMTKNVKQEIQKITSRLQLLMQKAWRIRIRSRKLFLSKNKRVNRSFLKLRQHFKLSRQIERFKYRTKAKKYRAIWWLYIKKFLREKRQSYRRWKVKRLFGTLKFKQFKYWVNMRYKRLMLAKRPKIFYLKNTRINKIKSVSFFIKSIKRSRSYKLKKNVNSLGISKYHFYHKMDHYLKKSQKLKNHKVRFHKNYWEKTLSKKKHRFKKRKWLTLRFPKARIRKSSKFIQNLKIILALKQLNKIKETQSVFFSNIILPKLTYILNKKNRLSYFNIFKQQLNRKKLKRKIGFKRFKNKLARLSYKLVNKKWYTVKKKLRNKTKKITKVQSHKRFLKKTKTNKKVKVQQKRKLLKNKNQQQKIKTHKHEFKTPKENYIIPKLKLGFQIRNYSTINMNKQKTNKSFLEKHNKKPTNVINNAQKPNVIANTNNNNNFARKGRQRWNSFGKNKQMNKRYSRKQTYYYNRQKKYKNKIRWNVYKPIRGKLMHRKILNTTWISPKKTPRTFSHRSLFLQKLFNASTVPVLNKLAYRTKILNYVKHKSNGFVSQKLFYRYVNKNQTKQKKYFKNVGLLKSKLQRLVKNQDASLNLILKKQKKYHYTSKVLFFKSLWNRQVNWKKFRTYFKRQQKKHIISLNPRFWKGRYSFRYFRFKRGKKIKITKKTRNFRKKRSYIGVYHRFPWLNPILYKRRLYRMHKRNLFLRMKMPSYHKRNQIYFRYTQALFHKWTPSIRRRQYFYLKKILAKIILAFYGHLRLKQFKKIVKSNNRLKPSQNSRISLLLNKLERRLDVVVYRMNFAPTIQWARELIRLGLISVNSSIITKPQFLVNNFSLIQFATMKRHREKLFHFFNTKLLKKTVPPYLQVNKTIQAGVFLYAPHKNMIRSNDRVKFSDLNVVRLINS